MTTSQPRERATRRPLRVAALAALTALLAVLVPVAAAGPAAAYGSYYGGDRYDGGYNGGYNNNYDSNGGYSGPVVVFPVLNCIQAGTNGAFTAVLGWKNTSSSTYTITGDYNVITPSSYNGKQPTVFKPGTYNGAFSLAVASGTTAYWTLGSTKITIGRNSASACPKDTQMPADGNGTGAAAALGVAAVAGALIVKRARRRMAGPTQETVDA